MGIRPAGSDDDGEVEFLDVGGAPARRIGPGRQGRRGRQGLPGRPSRRRLWWLLALAAVALATIGFGISRSTSDRPPSGRGSTGHPSSPEVATTSGEPSTALVQPPTGARPPAVTVVGHPLLGERGDWELVARGPSDLVRIQLGSGLIVHTDVLGLASDGGVSFIVGPDRVLIRPLDFVPGYVVRDGRQPAALPRSLARGPIFPGPRADQIWVPTGVGAVGTADSVQVLGLDGRPEGEPIPLPDGVQDLSLLPDGAGGLAFGGVGGYYRLRPRGWYRITSGQPLAVGPTRMLVEECDARYRCRDIVIRQQDDARLESLPAQPGDSAQFAPGVISPDGRTAAIPRLDANGRNTVRLIDLTTGTGRATRLAIDPQADPLLGGLVWSPDSRWVFGVSNGVIEALDARTRLVHHLGVKLLAVTQLGIRPGVD